MMLVVTTCPPEETDALVRRLVDEKWIACANIIPSRKSVYRWQGEVEESVEEVVLMKTRDDLVKGLEVRLVELHPYDVPEVIALAVGAGLPEYLSWVDEVTRPPDTDR